MIPALIGLGSTLIGYIADHFKRKQELKRAVTENKIRLAQSAQTHNQAWEMKQLENAGWKDDVLFYAFIALFIWAGFDPAGAKVFFQNLNVLPDWFVQVWMWIVASVLGVKKLGDYLPSLIKSVKEAVK